MSRRVSARSRRTQDLTIKDRLNFSYILAEYEIRMADILDLRTDPQLRQFRAFVNWLIHTIPDDWKDQPYYDEMAEANVRVIVDVRPMIAGFRLSFEYCEANKVPIYRQDTYQDPWKQHQGIINLWNRRGLLSKVKFKEVMTGRKFSSKSGEEIEVDLDETDILGEIYDQT